MLPKKKIDYQGSKSWLYPKTLQNSLQATRSHDQLHTDIGQFRIYIKEEFEKRIRHLPAIDDLDNDESEFAPKIAMISFAYNNSQIINQLKTRGDYIKAE